MKHQTIYEMQRMLNVHNEEYRQTLFIGVNLELHKNK